MLFIDNNATAERVRVPMGNDPMLCKGPIGDDIDLENRTDFLESVDTTIGSDLPTNVD